MAVSYVMLLCLLWLQLVSGDIINVALTKPTNVSSLYGKSQASNGVDGNKTTVDPNGSFLMHTDVTQTSAWWTVDLEIDVVDAEVKIYFRTVHKNRRNGTQLYTSQTPFSSYPGDQLCHEVTGRADGTDIPDVVSVNCTGTWRYLMVYTVTDNDEQGPILDFAEVEVLVCSNGTYDITCTKSCSSRHCADPCDRYNVLCVGGCDPGWIGNECTEECSEGKFGINCSLNCGNCTESDVCDHVTGDCPGECKPGYSGQQCREKCLTSKYGAGCNSTCGHCYMKETCHHVTGNCTRGCGKGWWNGPLCQQECPDGTYGAECNSTCGNCHGDKTCDHVTGNCPEGCSAGWGGPVCNENCSTTTYGAGCVQSCGQCRGQCDPQDGRCSGGCVDGFEGSHCKGDLTNTFLIPVVVGISVLLAIVIVVIVVVVLKRRSTRQKGVTTGKETNVYANISEEKGGVRLGSVPRPRQQQVAPVRPQHDDVAQVNTYANIEETAPEEDPIGVIRVEELADTIRKVKARRTGFASDYKRLPTDFISPYADSQLPQNSGKNKFKGYYPYDHNRVRLSSLPNVPCSDYINASIMRSYDRKKTYIAAQAPKEITVRDFWRMIWEQGCEYIVMLTNLFEENKEKCFQYWPEEDRLETDDVTVLLVSTDVLANYTVRNMKVTLKQSGKSRSTVQYHYTSWPDHGVPDTLALVNFIWMMRQETEHSNLPLLVHCSAGIGRTGTYIAVDSLLDQAREKGVVDVPGYVCVMREQRKGMVQTKEQYQCVFECLLEMTKFGNTSMDVENFTTSYSSRGMDSMVDRKTLREITQMTVQEKPQCASDKYRLWVNGDKNFLVRYGPSKRNMRGYLQTMSPSPGQEKLLWKLVEENNVHNIFIISTLKSDVIGETGKSHSFGAMTVTPRAQIEISPSLVQTPVNLEYYDPRVANVFTMTTSPTLENLSSWLLDNSRLQQLTRETTPAIIIHGGSDAKCSVLLCVLCNIVCEVLEDCRVDVIGQVRTFLRTCPDVTLSESEVKIMLDFAQRLIEVSSPSNMYTNM